MVVALKIVLIVLSVLMVVVILTQSGRSGGLSGVITGGSEQVSARRNKGLDSFLAKVTVVVAILFFATALGIALFLVHHP